MNLETPVTDIPITSQPAPTRRRRFRLTPLTRRRWYNFKQNKRGYWSLWIFLTLYVLSLFAEFIANDKPILVGYRGAIYAPVLSSYPETTFGGQFETEADYKDPAVQAMIDRHGWMLWPPVRFSYDTIDYDLTEPAPSPPSAAHPFGTDTVAQDIFAKIVYGFRLSITFALVLTTLSSIIGIAAGALQGYFGGWTDLLFQRVIEILQSLPMLYLLIIVASFITPSFFSLIGVLLLVSWMSLVQVVRAEFLRARNLDYVRAARALGLSDRKIMFKHVLPNAMVAAMTFIPFNLNTAIVLLTLLDFLNFGLPAGSPSLGELLLQARNNLHTPWLAISGFMTMAILLPLLIFIGEAVRDAFDPRKAT
jgi:microcin C transport system permease protein